MEKLITLQWLRGLAAMLVVWVHCIYLPWDHEIPAFQVDWGTIFEWGAVGVDIFFVISGFIVMLTATRARSVKSFMANRVRRIFPLYVVATIACVLLLPDTFRAGWHFVASLAMLAPINVEAPYPTLGVGWTLTYEFVFYAMIAAGMLWRSDRRELPERILIIACCAVLVSATLSFRPPFNVIGNPLALEFAMGVIIGWMWTRRPILPRWVAMVLFISGAVGLLYTALYGFGGWANAEKAMKGVGTWGRVSTWGLPAALLVAGAVFREQPAATKGRFFTLLGDASFSIYLSHAIVVELLHRNAGWMDGLSGDAIILVAVAICTVVGLAVYWAVERPLTWLVRRRWAPVRAPAGVAS